MRRWLEYAAVLALRAALRTLPRRARLGAGAALGRLFHRVHGRRRELALANLRGAFPARSERELEAILLSTCEHFGRHVVELLHFDALGTEQMARLVDVEGAARVEQALARGRGVIFCSGHFGYWEVQALVHAVLFAPVVMVARTLDNPRLDRLLGGIRTRVGTRVLPRQGAVRGLLRALRERVPVALMIDQHMQDRSAVTVTFFDRPAATTSVVAALALHTGAPVIPVFALPLPGGRYRLVYEAAVEPPPADDPEPVRTYMQRCTDVLERYVRRHPDLWLWMHRRWRTDAAAATASAGAPAVHGVPPAREDPAR